VSTAAREYFCTFANSWTEPGCDFTEQAKVPGRAAIVSGGRDGTTSARLHTEPSDFDVAGSGGMERNDLYLSQPGTADPALFGEGADQWWAHSIQFPNDFAIPNWHMYVLLDFHQFPNDSKQANFHINFQQRANSNEFGDLIFRGYGGEDLFNPNTPNPYTATIAEGGANPPISKNVWYDFVYHVKWSSGPDGYFAGWVRKNTEPFLQAGARPRRPNLISRASGLSQARQLSHAGLRSLLW
jgi:polysaccharide lyase-like protein